MALIFAICGVIVACLWIMKACDPFEDAADYLGRNMSEGTKGATINAIASSIPELLTASIFLFFMHDKAGFAAGIGTTAGSAMFNAALIPAACIFTVIIYLKTNNFKLSKKAIWRDGFFLILAEASLIYLLSFDKLTWWHGLIMIGIYGTYMSYLLLQNSIAQKKKKVEEVVKNFDDEEDDDEENTDSVFMNFIKFDYKNMFHRNKEFTTFTALLSLGLAVASISAACYILAESVVTIAETFKINTFFISVVVAAAATSVPDTIISMKDAVKGNYNDSISNAVGSNIFDICVCLGLPLMVYTIFNGPIEMANNAGVAELRIILLVFSVFVILMLALPKKIGLFTGLSFFASYIFYATYSLCRGKEVEWAVQLGEFITSSVSIFN